MTSDPTINRPELAVDLMPAESRQNHVDNHISDPAQNTSATGSSSDPMNNKDTPNKKKTSRSSDNTPIEGSSQERKRSPDVRDTLMENKQDGSGGPTGQRRSSIAPPVLVVPPAFNSTVVPAPLLENGDSPSNSDTRVRHVQTLRRGTRARKPPSRFHDESFATRRKASTSQAPGTTNTKIASKAPADVGIASQGALRTASRVTVEPEITTNAKPASVTPAPSSTLASRKVTQKITPPTIGTAPNAADSLVLNKGKMAEDKKPVPAATASKEVTSLVLKSGTPKNKATASPPTGRKTVLKLRVSQSTIPSSTGSAIPATGPKTVLKLCVYRSPKPSNGTSPVAATTPTAKDPIQSVLGKRKRHDEDSAGHEHETSSPSHDEQGQDNNDRPRVKRIVIVGEYAKKKIAKTLVTSENHSGDE